MFESCYGEKIMNRKSRVGVIGCGYWGPNLLRNFWELPDSEVVAVADKSDSRLTHIKNRFPFVQTLQDYQDLFNLDLDACVIATPPATHYTIANDCLEHGLHVLVEKPMTLSSADAKALIGQAEKRGLTLMVGHTFEYNAAVRRLKSIVDSNELGKVYHLNAVRVNLGLYQSDLDVIWDLAPHDISILLYVLGVPPLTISARASDSVFQGKADDAFLHLTFPDNIMAHIHVSWLHPLKVRQVTIVGSEKMLIYDDVAMLEKIRIYDKKVEHLPYTDTFGDFQCSYHYGDVITPYIKLTEPLQIECQHFLDCIRNGTSPQTSGYSGLRVVQVLEAAQRSLQNDGQTLVLEDAGMVPAS
jgi:predicted dehydrogenase